MVILGPENSVVMQKGKTQWYAIGIRAYAMRNGHWFMIMTPVLPGDMGIVCLN